VLEQHGWGELQTELNTLSKQGEWVAMGERITDEMLEEFAVVAEPAKVATRLAERFGGTIDRILCTFPFAADEERKSYFEELRGA
jgi:alkanesulfonate monooxygenase SsuD/methylene tetrahydromethanopterin reductase-like flavin-dependent oxidoreductase (luciferase family)